MPEKTHAISIVPLSNLGNLGNLSSTYLTNEARY